MGHHRRSARRRAGLGCSVEQLDPTLLQVGFSKIRLLVRRPPRTAETALPIAAEQYAFSTERHHVLSDDTISGITAGLAGTPIWTFWWD
jgi:hypothetical protein